MRAESSTVPVKVAVAADGEQPVVERQRAELDRPAELDPPGFGAVGPKRAKNAVGAAQQHQPIRTATGAVTGQSRVATAVAWGAESATMR